MDSTEYGKLVQDLSYWLRLRLDYEKGFYLTPDQVTKLANDMWHSGLLYRLLVEGKEPFNSPPPKSFSYPWYELFEKGDTPQFCECVIRDGNVLINQNSDWKLVGHTPEGFDPQGYIVSWADAEYVVWPSTDSSFWFIKKYHLTK